MITGYVYGGTELRAKFDRMPSDMRGALSKGIGRAVLKIQRHVVQDKLSGQVLNVKTGRLRRSITSRVTEQTETVTGIVGTNVSYAAAHEYGFQGTVSVRDHLRTSKLGKAYNVSAHSRNVHIPEKSFLRSALDDLRGDTRDEIEGAINTALREKFR